MFICWRLYGKMERQMGFGNRRQLWYWLGSRGAIGRARCKLGSNRPAYRPAGASCRGGYGTPQVQAEVFTADLAEPQAPAEIFRFIEQKRLPIEILINNAGFGAYGEFHKAEAQRLLDMVQVNVASVVHLTHLFLPAMVDRRSGYILIVASTAAFQPVPYISTYAATKGFDLLFAEGISEEARRYGVHVCALCPGSTVSEFHEVAQQPLHMAGPQEPNEKVARVGLQALAAGKPRVISGARNWLSVEAQRIAPRRLVTRVAARMFMPQQ